MKLLILLCTIVLVRATSVPENCNGVRIANSPVLYEREILKSGLDSPHSLTVDHSTNTLYFSYYTEEGQSIAAKIDLNDKKFKNIVSVPEGFALAVDNKTNEVYISGMNGIYKYDPKTDTGEIYAFNHTNIWYMYFHEYLYYVVHPAEFLNVIKNDEDVRAKDIEETTVEYFVIDKDDDIFYSNETGVYGQKKGTKKAELYKKAPSLAKYLTTDKNGIVHLSMFYGIYVVDKDAKIFRKILTIDFPTSLAFDRNNNIIYSDDNGIYILKPNKNLTC